MWKIILLSILFLICSVRNVLPCESTSDYDTSLVEIIESGDLEGVKTAIASGIGVDDIVNPATGVTVWMIACHGGNFDIIKFLIDSGANVN